MIKRILGIVSAVCILATMCVGLSIAGSAAEATDTVYATTPVVDKDAKNYAASLTDGKVSTTAATTVALTGLTADDSYLVSFTTTSPKGWGKFNVRFAKDGDKFQGFTFRGNTSGAYTQYGSNEVENDMISRYGTALNDSSFGTNGSNHFRTLSTAADQTATRYDILVTKSVETGKRRIVLFQDGKVVNCKRGYAFDLKFEEAIQPHLVFDGLGTACEFTDIKVVKLGDDKDDTTTTTTTGATTTTTGATTTTTGATTTTTGATTTTTAKPTTTTTTAPKKDIAFPNSPVPNKDAKNYADIDKATFTGSAEKLENGNLKNAGEDPNNGRTHGNVTVPLTGLKKTDSYVISFTTTINAYDNWQILHVLIGKSEDGKKYQMFDLRGNGGTGSGTPYHEFNNEIPMDTRIEADRIEQNNQNIDSNNYRGQPTATKGEMTRFEIVVTNSVETGERRILLFQNGVPVICRKTKAAWDMKNQEALDPCLVFVGQTAKTGSFEIQNLKVYKLSDTKNYGNVADDNTSSSNGATTGNASRAIGALAITACVALPVIFATKKRKEA